MSATIGGKSLGNVSSEESAKTSGLFNTPLPFSDSDDALIMDLMGTTRTVSITGNFTGTTAELITYISDIENLQNGEQSAQTFVSSWYTAYSGTTFLIQDFSHSKSEGDENRVNYNLSLLQGSVL